MMVTQAETVCEDFQKEHDYIAVSMVVVLREFQGRAKILSNLCRGGHKGYSLYYTDTPLKVKNILMWQWNYVAKKLKNGISLPWRIIKINMDSGNEMFQMLSKMIILSCKGGAL